MDNNAVTFATLENLRRQLIRKVNHEINVLVNKLEQGGTEGETSPLTETMYLLTALPPSLKGSKPTAVFFGEERVLVKTWRGVYSEISSRCASESATLSVLMELRGKVAGRARVILSDKPDGMGSPVMLAENLYAEAYFDTDMLLKVMTEKILNAAGYDYSNISIAVKN